MNLGHSGAVVGYEVEHNLHREVRKWALRFFCFYPVPGFPEGGKGRAGSNCTRWIFYP